MRNKKYRCWKLILILTVVAISGFIAIPFLKERIEKILLLVCDLVLIVVAIILFPLYLEVQSDRIITTLGVFSTVKKLESSFKKRVFMFDDISDICVEGRKILRIYFKDGNQVGISIDGSFRKREIISLVYEARAKIKGYEQQYVTNDTTK